MKLLLCSIVVFDFQTFDYVRLFNCSISKCSIVFDCQNFESSSINFDYWAQSKSIEQLGFDYRTFDWLRRANKFLQLFTCPGRGILDFKWQGWWNGAKIKTPKKSLDQNLAPKKSHAEFPSLKNFQKALNDITRKIETLVLNTPKKSLVNRATQNNPKSKISNPKKSFDYLFHLKSRVPRWVFMFPRITEEFYQHPS